MRRIRLYLTPVVVLALSGWLLVACRHKGEHPAPQPKQEEQAAPSEESPQLHHEHEPQAEPPVSPKPGEKTVYHCPMHPEYTSDKPGNCPICGMTLVPVRKEAPSRTEKLAPGTVELSPERQQLLGLTFGQAERRRLTKEIRAVGQITYDETRLKEVNLKFSGWIEELYVDFVGKLVHAGDPLFSIYSPELVAAQEEYLLVLPARGSSAAIWEAARRKLLLWGLLEGQLQELEKNGKPSQSLKVYAPATGYVVEKNVLTGKYVQAGETLYRIADLSTVWLVAAVYEEDLSLLRPGQTVSASLVSAHSGMLRGSIQYINPYVNETTRTAEVRVTLPNPDGKLLPGMYAYVQIPVDLGERLVVPEEAILFSGTRYLTFVDRGEGMLEPIEIEPGVRTGAFVEVLRGLAPGDRVLTSANFLIDSESKLRLALGRTHEHGMRGKM
ncbi:MAG: efflux RND transporter periplasmic adaptor subunit [candidate division KSB1 bacterium]|nr:efflux RND transporter periplasmic adaptor subunit [candidate division KSB1 bacterium]